jgi:hypothetical protein
VHECPNGEPDAGTKSAGHDRNIGAFLPIRARASGDDAGHRTRAGPNEHRHAEWAAADGDLANGVSGEVLLASLGVDGDLSGGEAGQATGGPDA